jgi:hypothetical protein
MLEALGFAALATTSSSLAFTLGRLSGDLSALAARPPLERWFGAGD